MVLLAVPLHRCLNRLKLSRILYVAAPAAQQRTRNQEETTSPPGLLVSITTPAALHKYNALKLPLLFTRVEPLNVSNSRLLTRYTKNLLVCWCRRSKYFYLYYTSTKDENESCCGVKEINKKDYFKLKLIGRHVVAVHELAFDQEVTYKHHQGSSNYYQHYYNHGDFGSEPGAPALRFNIKDCDVQVATVDEIRDIAQAKKDLERKGGKKNSFFNAYWMRSSNPELPFNMIYATRLNDPVGVHNLVIDVLIYMSDKLQSKKNLNFRNLVLLQQRFEWAKRSIEMDKWPICESMVMTNEEVASNNAANSSSRTYDDNVPTADRQYKVSKMSSSKYFLFQSLYRNVGKEQINHVSRDDKSAINGRPRLSIFVDLVPLLGVTEEAEGGHDRTILEENERLFRGHHCDDETWSYPCLGKIEFVENLGNPDSEWKQILAKYREKECYY
mmetsp:Transcript_8740/g.16491  ORF Transcript_8740/g.16491 Transcript_8740/m.16491 type:complete len:443 (+) Transcript_8740:300-1628(+)